MKSRRADVGLAFALALGDVLLPRARFFEADAPDAPRDALPTRACAPPTLLARRALVDMAERRGGRGAERRAR